MVFMSAGTKVNLKKTSLINWTGHPIMHRKTQIGIAFSYLERNYFPM